MYSPLNRLINTITADRVGGGAIRSQPHWMLNLFEILAFISFLPGMFLYLFLFVISGINLAVCIEIERGSYVAAGILLVAVDIVPSIVIVLGLINGVESEPPWFAIIYGTLGVVGLMAIVAQRKSVRSR